VPVARRPEAPAGQGAAHQRRRRFNNELVKGYKKTGESDQRVAVEGKDFETSAMATS
jgi:hypothetical protein